MVWNEVVFYNILDVDIIPWMSTSGATLYIHNVIKQWAFVHVGLENLIRGCPNLMQITT